MSNPSDLIEQAIRKAGSQRKLADLCGCKQQSISDAKERGRVSSTLAMKIENATGGEVLARDLRPDLPWPATPISAGVPA